MHQRSSNLCAGVIPVHELKKCVIPVPKRYSGLTKVQTGLNNAHELSKCVTEVHSCRHETPTWTLTWCKFTVEGPPRRLAIARWAIIGRGHRGRARAGLELIHEKVIGEARPPWSLARRGLRRRWGGSHRSGWGRSTVRAPWPATRGLGAGLGCWKAVTGRANSGTTRAPWPAMTQPRRPAPRRRRTGAALWRWVPHKHAMSSQVTGLELFGP
jgi:hypothetical protein